MTFDELVAEVGLRGFSHVQTASPGRIGAWVNAAVMEVTEAFLWPFREKSAVGTAPLVVADLGVIEAVIDEDNNDQPLASASFQDLLSRYGELATDGTPFCFYVGTPSGVPTVATYPTSDHTIGVQYWKTAATLSGSTTPDVPARYHQLLVDVACRRGYYDTDEFEKARGIQVEIDRQMGVMVNSLLGGQQVVGAQGESAVLWAVDG